MDILTLTDVMPFLFLLLSLGCIAGVMAGMLGIGGGILLVPGFVYIFTQIQSHHAFDPEHIMHIAVATSLAVIVPTGLSSSYAHYQRGSIDIKRVKLMGIGVIVGVMCASMLAGIFDKQTMTMIFACIVPFLAVFMIVVSRDHIPFVVSEKPKVMIGSGCFIGFISALVGIGGATMSVPLMTAQKVPIYRAVGTASLLGVVISVPATFGFVVIGWNAPNLPPFSFGYVNVLACLCVIPTSILCAPIGARFAHKVPTNRLKMIFAVFIIIVAVKMWLDIVNG